MNQLRIIKPLIRAKPALVGLLTAMLYALAVCCYGDVAGPRFALYLVKAPFRDSHGDIEKVTLESEPLLTEKDLASYDWQTHTLTLTHSGAQRIPKLEDVGTGGKAFVIMADGQRCYQGAFWTSLSSCSSSLPVIDVWPRTDSFQIQRAYPSAKFAVGDDPRPDERIRRVLKALGKIKDTAAAISTERPPLDIPKEVRTRDELVRTFGSSVGFGPVQRAEFRRSGRQIFAVWYCPFSGRSACFLQAYYYDPARIRWTLFIDRLVEGTYDLSAEMPWREEALVFRDAEGKVVVKESVANLPAEKWYEGK